jgi:hypothetical protein
MPEERFGMHRASAVMTLAVSVIVTLALVLAAAGDTRPGDADPACGARGACAQVLSR